MSQYERASSRRPPRAAQHSPSRSRDPHKGNHRPTAVLSGRPWPQSWDTSAVTPRRTRQDVRPWAAQGPVSHPDPTWLAGVVLQEAAMVQETGERVLAGLDPGLEPPLASAAGAVGDHAWLAGVLPAPPARLLDAGCGDGAVAGWLAGLGYQVTAIDADPGAVARARAAGVPAIQADLVSYADRPFDAVLMLLTLHHMHPLPQALETVTRLLRPAGRLVIDEFAWDWADPATIGWFEDIAAILIAAGIADPAAGPLSPVGPLAAAGLGDQA